MKKAAKPSKEETTGIYIRSKRNFKIALYWLLGPVISIAVIMVVFALTNVLLLNAVGKTSPVLTTINFLLAFLGFLAIVAVPIGIVMGILYLRKKEWVKGAKWDLRSGKGEASTIPPEIQKWNWGAAGLTWIWGTYHSVWISLLVFIPLVNIIMIVLLGIKGNEWAWRKDKWENVEKFLEAQNKWQPWGIIFLILMIFSFTLQIKL